jgi:gliding motility-associated-like protein
MSNEHNIDKLLKESFDNFSPETPDVWQAVQQGVQAAQASAAASSGVGATAVVQGVSLTVKIVAGIAIAAASVTGYLVYTAQANKDDVKVADAVVKEQIVNQPEPLIENDQTIKEDHIAAVSPKNGAETTKQPVSVSHSAKQNPKGEEENRTIIPPVSVPETGLTVAETKNSEPNTTPDIKETATIEAPKTVTKTYPNDAGKGDISKPAADKVSKVKPYNPYAEDGEIYDKPTIPGAISPNDDGLNDKFKIIIENETYYSLRIINEKGDTVFESKNKEQLWDGKHYKTGKQCQAGNFIYVLNYQYKGSEKVHEASGLVKLIF